MKAGIAQPSLGPALCGGGGGAERWMTLGTDDSLRKTEDDKNCSNIHQHFKTCSNNIKINVYKLCISFKTHNESSRLKIK